MLLEAGNAAQRGSPVAILGTGPFAQGLAALALRSGACFGRNVRVAPQAGGRASWTMHAPPRADAAHPPISFTPLHPPPCPPWQVRIGSRRQPDGAVGSLPGLEGIDVMSVGEALAGAGIVVLATPAHTHPHLVREHGCARKRVH